MKQLLKDIVTKFGYQVQGTRYIPRQLLDSTCLRGIEFDDVICRRMFEVGPEINFIQIGAFDGITKDPLHKYIRRCGWQGVLVEPQLRAVNQLRDLYLDKNQIVILQAALDQHRGKRTLYTVESDIAPVWAGGLASFQRETLIKHSTLIPGLEKMITESLVDVISFDEVLSHLHSTRLDLLQIDTEGADGYILSLFPFERVLPAIIHWEIKHLTKIQREACFDRLSMFGYRFAKSGDEDMLAVQF